MFKDESKFEKVVNRLNIDTKPKPAHRENLRREMLATFNEEQPASRTLVFRTLRRTIMKSPTTKIAVAAAIIIAVLIGFLPIGSSTPAFAEIIQPFLTARTASFQMTMNVEGGPTQTFDCLYCEPIRMRQTNKEQGAVVITDLQEGKIVTLVPAQKKAYVIELENIPDDQDLREFNMFNSIRQHILEDQESEDASVEFLGEKKINSLTVIGYHVQKPDFEITVWADSKTKLPVELTYTVGSKMYSITDIVFNIELDELLFSLEVPAEYKVQGLQFDVSEPTSEKTYDGQALVDKAVAMGADIPADKRSIVARMLSLNEKDLIAGLRVFAELSGGRYPKKLDAKSVIKEADGLGAEVLRDASREVKKQKFLDIFFAAAFHDKLVREKKDVAYYGDKVTPEDSDKVLVRWKVGKNEYRIFSGNLAVKSVTEKELAGLERVLKVK